MKTYPYKDNTLDIETRVNDLINRMTLEEKVSQMLHYSPAIERLGIPAYNWWNECLHGVARAGVATVFPQAIGLAATFDKVLLKKVADTISTEARAKHHEFIREKDRGIYKGLTFWSPNINIFRDPRWGRGHETYGEDPYLTGELGRAFIEGLQGDDEKYLKVAACAKHFAVHSGPENLRHEFNATVSKKDLYETYLPAFEKAVCEAKVEAVMGAYNRVNGEPSCGSTTLLRNVLRDKWGFKGHVVSDCWAICDFHLNHKVTSNAIESAAMAVRAGSDLNCGNTYAHLLVSINQGLLDEKDIDKAVKRLFMTRFKLGMFDPEEEVKYAQIPYEMNDCKEHHDLSINVARRSMVLLKNDGLLPLDKKKLKTVAVIGPNADDPIMLLGNYHGTPSRTVTPLEGIRSEIGDDVRVVYAKGCEVVKDRTEQLAEAKDRMAEAISAAKMADIAIVCLGLNAEIEGEEGDASNSEAAGDKTSLLFPGNQNELLQKVIETNTPTLLVVFTGSALDLRYANQHANGIIQAWYPGSLGGIALADLIFGKYDFSGRLPITFVKDINDLPEFTNYSMKGRTYRYMDKEPLYSFGFGLSYNKYLYKDLCVSIDYIKKKMNVGCSIVNNGQKTGRECVQTYVRHLNSKEITPNYQLINFEIIEFKPYEEKNILFTVDIKELEVYNEKGQKYLETGRIEISVGGICPNESSKKMKKDSFMKVEVEIRDTSAYRTHV